MGLRKALTSMVSTLVLMSMFSVSAYAQDYENSGSYIIENAPSGAEYSVYVDTNSNYIYDDEDTFVGSFKCNDDGIGYFENLSANDYVAVLDTDYSNTNFITNKQYAFSSNGKDCVTQECYITNSKFNLNTSRASMGDSVSIHYDVPLFRQNDENSTWVNLHINGSSDTMRKYGCLICSFAMMYSYQVGYNVYPDVMMQPYSSTNGVGVVYATYGDCSMVVPSSAENYGWGVYGTGTNEFALNEESSQETFKVLYEKLQNGPVILGAYSTNNSRGSSNHWIVVSGYTGDGQNFQAKDFTICDPGFKNNTTLDQFLVNYKYWDRIIYNKTLSINNTCISSSNLMGDVNLDGKINIADVLELKKYVLRIDDLSSEALKNADVNNNGFVEVNDLVTLRLEMFK